MAECNDVVTPLEARAKFTSKERSPRVNSTVYMSLIGSLRYLTHTRPDLLFSVGILSRYMENLAQEHYSGSGVKWVLRYVKGSPNYGVFYKKGDSNAELFGFSDSDFSGDINDWKSTSSHIFFLGGKAVTWASQKHCCLVLV